MVRAIVEHVHKADESGSMTAFCRHCKIWKPLLEFKKSTVAGCKKCLSEINKLKRRSSMRLKMQAMLTHSRDRSAKWAENADSTKSENEFNLEFLLTMFQNRVADVLTQTFPCIFQKTIGMYL